MVGLESFWTAVIVDGVDIGVVPRLRVRPVV